MYRIKNSLIFFLIIFSYTKIYAEENKQLKVYINSESIDFDFLREHINYVDYVYDPQSCDVQIILLKQGAANGGFKYAIQFIGKNFNDINDFILNTTILPNDSEDIERKKLTRTIKSGLFPFINEKDPFQKIDIMVKSNEEKGNTISEDNWNKWVFNLNGAGGFHMEENYNSNSYKGIISANQIKDNFKFENRFYLYGSKLKYDFETKKNIFHPEDSTTTTTTKDTSIIEHINIGSIYSKLVFSINGHWSAGLALFYKSDSRINTKHLISIKPAIEYNFFPWSKSNKIFLTASYTIGPQYVKYEKQTKYLKSEELLWNETAYIKFLTKQTWGEAYSMITYSNYLNQWTNYNLSIDSEVLFYLTKGLSLSLSLRAEDVNDQRYIPLNNYTNSQIIMGVVTQETGYYLIGSIGLNFRFGSLTNNIVNRRL